MDFKKKYIVKCIEALLCLSEEPEELVENEKLEDFINSNQIHVLLILYRPGKKLKTAFPEEDFPLNNNILMVTILKINLEVTPANLTDSYNISLSTADCLRNLANDLNRYYLPALSERNQNLRGLMTGLKKTLGNQQDLKIDHDENVVDTPFDQFNYWKKAEELATSADAKKRAQYFQECYKDIEKGWSQITQLQIKEIKELFQTTFAALDDVWGDKYTYPPKRFANLVKTFTTTLWHQLSSLVPRVETGARTKVLFVQQAMKAWIKLLDEYRDVNWRHKPFGYAQRTGVYTDKIEDVKSVLILFDELRFIKEKAGIQLDLNEAIELFVGTVPLSLNPVLSRNWGKVKKVFIGLIESKAVVLSTYFRENILSTTRAAKKPLKVLQDMHKWNALLNLGALKDVLNDQKKQVFKVIQKHFDSAKLQFESRTGQALDPLPGKSTIPQIKNFSPFLCAILYGRRLQDKLKRTLAYCEQIFKKLPDIQNFKYECDALLKDLQSFENDQLNSWKSQMTEAQYSDAGLGLNMGGKMMDLDLNRSILNVNYSDRLILLIRELRQLAELGLKSKVSQQILDVAQQGKRYYKQALSLKKIANFYNNMGEEIIDSQKGMVLKQLQAFEQCVRNVNNEMGAGGQLTWDKPANVEKYIENLSKATSRLLKQNSRLRKIHENIMQIIIQLANQDLRKSKSIWISKLQHIRSLVEMACAQKEPKYCRKWKVHCDVQLFKVLQMQFLAGIEQGQNILPQIQVEIILKNKQLQLKPSLEELRDRYYREITAYVSWPARVFRGILGNLDLYQKLGERNGLALKALVSRAETTFAGVSLQLRNLQAWSAIPFLTTKDIGQKIKGIQQWQFNIRVIRLKRKELQKVPDYSRVDCFSISQTKFKNSADELLSDFLQKMMNCLRDSVAAETNEVKSFLDDSLVKLSKKSSTLEETHQNKATYLQIKMRQKEMKKKLDEILMKKKWILQATGYNHPTQEVQEAWDQFSEKVQDYDTLVAQQIQHLKTLVDKRARDLQADIAKYSSKTASILIPNNRSQMNQLLNYLKTQREEEGKLLDQVKKLKVDCQQFELPAPLLNIKQVDWEQWSILQQYCEGLKKYEAQLFVKMKLEKLYQFQDYCTNWSEKVKGKEMTRQIVYVIKQTDLFKTLFILFRTLSSGILERDHWKQFWTLIRAERSFASESVRLGDMLGYGRSLVQKQILIQQLLSKAQGEATLRQALQQLAIWWETAEFELTVYEGKRGKCSLIRQWKEMTSKVSDNGALVSSLKDSRYVGRFQQQVLDYDKKIGKIERALYSLNMAQRRWIYLQPILVGGALPDQLDRFLKLDAAFKTIMNGLEKTPKLQTLADMQGLQQTLDNINEEQQRCQKALNDFLQVKRSKFPRFYFLGDEDLLQILAQTQNPTVIQLHLKKLFAAIHTVGFSADNANIIELFSSQKERVTLTQKVQLTENVQDWLTSLQRNMFITLQGLLRQYISSGTKDLKLNQYPSQILCLMQEIRFSNELENAVKSKTLQNLDSKLRHDLLNLTKLLPTVSRLEVAKLKAIILDLIHHLNIVSLLIKEQKPVTLTSYNYKKNFRFTAAPQMHLFEYKYRYTFEYQGNLPKLVHTPLTDKCYITLALALSMGLGGNPYGPAGTGKTQTVKAMAMLFGRMCLVFNCDEGLDYKSMARIFLGLVRCGAWGCFDEFNRLLEQQLSAISQQIQVIQFAIKAQQPELQLIGKRVSVNPNSGIFVTLNPAGKGYGGRSRLPDNLKQLFRPVAMSVPDNQLIAQVLLYAQGFREAKQLAGKVICLFTLGKQLLSQQQHYDWGLRALKTVLSVAGRLIAQQRTKSKAELYFETECQLLIKAIRVNTLSKLTWADMRKFTLLLADIFPGANSTDIVYEEVGKAVRVALEELKLSSNDAQIAKILQFYEATQQRMGVVLVGPSGCGKTTIWKVLKRALQKLGKGPKTFLMNPKAMPRTQLLGYMNNDTREFSEGVLTVSARQVVKSSVNSWIILDGDIDPEWVQSLNSVLDDNHLLTLPTGERINFPNGTVFIFQTDSLTYASPATVSRMGMIYLNNEDINISGILAKWLESHQQLTSDLQSLQVQSLLAYDEVVPSTLVGQVNQILSQMTGVKTRQEFIAAAIRGLTANCLSDKSAIASKVFQKFQQKCPVSNKQATMLYAEGKVYRTYSTLPAQFTLQEVCSEQGAVLHTAAVQSALAVLKHWVESGANFIVVGPGGCGKGMLIREAFTEIRKHSKINFATMYCNSQTNAGHVIQKLYQICAKGSAGSGKILRPKQCARQILFLKDINLPKPDKYQTVQLASFLQQLISHRGFYDPVTLEFVQLDDKVQVVVSMFPPSALGRSSLTPRFTAVVRILSIEYPSIEDLGLIYTEYFRSLLHARRIEESMSKQLSALVIDAYAQIRKNYSVDQHRHYIITPKSLLEIFKNLTLYDFNDQNGLLDALLYEFNSYFKNRIVGADRKSKFDQLITTLFRNNFKNSPKSDSLFSNISGKLMKVSKEDYLSQLRAILLQFERQYREIAFVTLDEVISQISSAQKALSGVVNPHLLLVGSSGVGRQTTLLLASLSLKLQLLRIPTVRDLGVRQFRKELKSILQMVVNQNKKAILFLQDHNFSKPEFIEMINSLIISGQIPGLFGLDQLERLPSADQMRAEEIGRSLQQAFALRVRRNLKVVISLDNRRQSYAEVCASNPALFTCNIIWFDNPSLNSLKTIAAETLSKSLPEFSRATIDQVASKAAQTHKNVEQKFSTPPRQFFTLLSAYSNIFKLKSLAKKAQGQRLQKGLQKLEEAKKLVDELSKEAYEKQKLLQTKQAQASKALIEIERAVGQATKRRNQTEELSRSLQVEQQKIVGKKKSVEEELAEVQPLIEQAKKSVSSISSSNLNELASLPKPPQAVKVVLKVVVRMFGQHSDEWNAIKNFIKKRDFISNVLNFDPRNLTGDLRKDIEKEIERNQNSFTKQTIYRASLAAGPLADWTKAILRYSKVVQTIKPLETQLNKLMKALQGSKKRVIECEEELAVIDKKVRELKSVFAAKTGEAQVLKNQLQRAQSTLGAAKGLLNKLDDERSRWDQDFKQIEKQTRQYPISSLIASSFVSYLSDRDQNQRQTMIKQWRSSYGLESFNFLKFMVTQGQQLRWKSLGLASDSLSIENSVMIFNSGTVPLILDPTSQAIEWLRKCQQKIQTVSHRHPKFANTLELAVRFGKQLLVLQVQQVEALLVPIVRRDLQQEGSRVVVKAGDKNIDYSANFKLYLSTRNTNIELLPNTRSLITFINYSVTRSGLESKLLSLVINNQQPELQKRKSELLAGEDKLRTSLVALQDSLLQQLANSQGNILENRTLLDSLTRTKTQSAKIAQGLKESQILNAQLDQSRQVYKPLACKGALLYLKMGQLNKINNMYRFSLAYFTRLFLGCLANNENNKLSIAPKDPRQKLQLAETSLVKIVFNTVAGSLFKADRLTLALFLMKSISTDIPDAEWDFLTGTAPPPLENRVVLPQWASFERQQMFDYFACSIPKLAKSINFSDSGWNDWINSQQPQKNYPGACSKLTKFQKVLLIHVFRPQKLQIALINLACEVLGVSSISGTNITIKHVAEKECNNDVPALFIVSTGYDPSKQLEEYCEAHVGRENYLQLSMGGGQNETALAMMKTASEKGQWLCLKNLHLVTSWLTTLQKQFRAIQNKHSNFKLFLTSQQHVSFPSVLLETCFKLSYQSPPGLKKNFLRTYQSVEGGTGLKSSFTFALAYFQALVQERRTYIPQGWSKAYEFSYSDLKVSLEIIDNLIKEYQSTKTLNFQTLYGIFEEGIYGGRIDNFSDLKVLRAYLRKYFNQLVINSQYDLGFGMLPKNQKELTTFVNKMPEVDDPSTFGLPKNIDKAVQRSTTEAILKDLKVLSLAHSEGTVANRDEELKIVNPILKLWNQTYKQIKDSKFPTIKNSQLLCQGPIQSFIYLQATQSLELTQKINRKLQQLDNVLQGKRLMTTDMRLLLDRIVNRTLPKEWEQFWAETQDPAEWIRRFGRKILLLKNWVIRAKQNRIRGEQWDLAELFHPVVFINACKQAASRGKVALDRLSFVSTFEQSKSSPNAVKLKGLLLQGCSLQKHLLGPLSQKDEEFQKLPLLYLDFLPSPPPLYPNEEQFCLFSSVSRESLLVRLKMGIVGEASQKIIAGTAFFLREI